MSGGGSKPRGGKMGTSIRAASVSGEAVANAEKELSTMVEKLNNIRQRIAEAVRRYQAAEKGVVSLAMELAKSQKEVTPSWEFTKLPFNWYAQREIDALGNSFQQIDSLNSQHSYLEKQLDSLEVASRPGKDELDRLEELRKIISKEEKEIDKLVKGSKQLKDKVGDKIY